MARAPDLTPQWFQILLALAEGELHGLGIMKQVLDQTDGRMRLWPTTLYGSLKRLAEDGLISEREGPEGPGAETDRRRFYGLTARGRRALAAEASRLASYVDTARRRNIPVRP